MLEGLLVTNLTEKVYSSYVEVSVRIDNGVLFGMEAAKFGGHEGFPLRPVWPLKLVRALEHNPAALAQEDASATFGVGKNMVTSMRHWGVLGGLIEPDPEMRHGMRPTFLGNLLFGGDAPLDPYFESPSTSWILHHRLATYNSGNTVFGWFFGRFARPSFNRPSLYDSILGDLPKLSAGRNVSPNTVRKDIDLMLRSYLPLSQQSEVSTVEDTAYASPLSDLSLIRVSRTGQYELNKPTPSHVPLGILLVAIFEYWSVHLRRARTITFDSLMFPVNAPGRLMVMRPEQLAEALEALDTQRIGIRYDETAGVRSIAIDPRFADRPNGEWISSAYN